MLYHLSTGKNHSIAIKRCTSLSYSGHTSGDFGRLVTASFGIRDQDTLNVDFKFILGQDRKGKYIAVIVNGLEEEKRIEEDDSLNKEQLARKSIKYVTDRGR